MKLTQRGLISLSLSLRMTADSKQTGFMSFLIKHREFLI